MPNKILIKTIVCYMTFFNTWSVNSQDVRKHFIEFPIPLNDSTHLITIIDNPQTETARSLGNRMFSDTILLKQINEKWFKDLSKEESEVITFCLPDVHFYLLQKGHLKYLSGIHSQCSPGNWQCDYLDSLTRYGASLKTDTIHSKTGNLNKKQTFNKNYIGYNLPFNGQWYYSKTAKYPRFYYDYSFKHILVLNHDFSVHENIINFLKEYKSDLLDINYNAWEFCQNEEDKNLGFKKYLKFGTPCELEIQVFLLKKDLKYFKSFNPEKTKSHESWTKPTILFYKK